MIEHQTQQEGRVDELSLTFKSTACALCTLTPLCLPPTHQTREQQPRSRAADSQK